MKYNVDELIKRYPVLEKNKNDINKAFELLRDSFKNGHKLLIAGNGGSNSDADHIVGELMKGFVKCRKVNNPLLDKINEASKENGVKEFADKLQLGLPAINLGNHQSLNTAFMNDVPNGGELIFAQQLLNFAEEGDVFLAISTSGNSLNVLDAAIVAKAKGVKIIALTGKSGGKLKGLADVSIVVDEQETFKIQELHLPIYHCLCLMLEEEFFE